MVYIYLGTSLSPSTQSSRRPSSTADTSRYGSQTVKPRPRRSIAARRIGLKSGRRWLGGCSSRNVRALPTEAQETSNSYTQFFRTSSLSLTTHLWMNELHIGLDISIVTGLTLKANSHHYKLFCHADWNLKALKSWKWMSNFTQFILSYTPNKTCFLWPYARPNIFS